MTAPLFDVNGRTDDGKSNSSPSSLVRRGTKSLLRYQGPYSISLFWPKFKSFGLRDRITISQCFFNLNSSRWGRGVKPYQDGKNTNHNLNFSWKLIKNTQQQYDKRFTPEVLPIKFQKWLNVSDFRVAPILVQCAIIYGPARLCFHNQDSGGGGGSELSWRVQVEKTLWNCDAIPKGP